MEINWHYRKKKPQRCGLSVHQRRCLGPDSCLSRKNTGQVTRLNVSGVLRHETSDQIELHMVYWTYFCTSTCRIGLFVCVFIHLFIYLPLSVSAPTWGMQMLSAQERSPHPGWTYPTQVLKTLCLPRYCVKWGLIIALSSNSVR